MHNRYFDKGGFSFLVRVYLFVFILVLLLVLA